MDIVALRKLLILVAAFLVAGAGMLWLVNQATTGAAQTPQAELWQIASLLHAPGDTTNQTVLSSTVPAAWTLRAEIAQLLAKGENRSEILHVIELQYGPTVLADPSGAGFGLWVWVLPGVALALGLGAAIGYLSKRRDAGAGGSVQAGSGQSELIDAKREEWIEFL